MTEDEKWAQKNKKILMDRQVNNTIKAKIDAVFNEIREKEHPVTHERDYTLLKTLPEYCIKSEYFKKIINNLGTQICESVSSGYFGTGLSIDRFYEAMKDLADLYLLDHNRFPSLNHYAYMIEEKNIINSVLSENTIEDLKEIASREFLANLPKEIFTAYFDAEELYKQNKHILAYERALHAKNSDEDLNNIKRALIFAAMIEGDDEEATDYYKSLSFINRKTFGRFMKDGDTITEFLNVDMLIAETIRLSKTKSFSELNKSLNDFLNLTAKIYQIDAKQYNILQNIFAYYNAFEQEMILLEAMVSNKIARTPEQEERLILLKEHKNTNFASFNVDVGESDSDNENSDNDSKKFIYEYRALLWSDKETRDYFDSLSVQNQVARTPYVVSEWTKNITASNINWDVRKVAKSLNETLTENFGDKFKVVGGYSCSTGAINDADESILVADISQGGYNWLWFNVTGEQMLKNQVTVSIYATYMSDLDVNSDDSIIDRNKAVCNRLISLKQKQNPKVNNYIQTVTDIIIKEIETFINSQSTQSIYD